MERDCENCANDGIMCKHCTSSRPKFIPKQQETKPMKVEWKKLAGFYHQPGQAAIISKCGEYYALLDIEVEQPEELVTVTIECSKMVADTLENGIISTLVKSFTRSDNQNKESKCS